MKKIIIVGIGLRPKSMFNYVYSKLVNEGYYIVALADNDVSKHNLLIKGLIVDSIENSFRRNPDSFVVIATIKEYDALTNQLESLGLRKSIDFEYAFRMSFFNPNSYAYYKQIIKNNGQDYPSTVRIEISSYCNLKCLWCRYHSDYMETLTEGCNKNLDMDTFKEIIKQIDAYGTVEKILNVQKGEMFCNPLWYEMLKYITENSKVKKFHFSTNGMLLTKDAVDKLCSLSFEEISITISLDGNSPEENDRLRKNADFNVIAENVHYLLVHRKENFVIQIQNTQLLDKLELQKMNENIQLEIADDHYLKREFGDNISIDRFTALFTNYDSIDNAICKSQNAEIQYVKRLSAEGCPLPLRELTIDSEGYVCVCGCEPWGQLLRIDNIKNKTLLEIWNSPIMKSIRECYKNGEMVPLCKNCISNALSNDEIIGVFVKKDK